MARGGGARKDVTAQRARPAAAPLKMAGARARALSIVGGSSLVMTRKKYRGEFGRYHKFCVDNELNYAAMDNECILAFIDSRCKAVKNSVSARQWRSQIWSHAEQKLGLRAYDEGTDGRFWKRAYKGLAVRHGCDSFTPNALGKRELLKIRAALDPDITRDPVGYNDWLHLLFSKQLTLRPNEHTGAGAKCVAGNIRFKRTSSGVKTLVYTFARGSTKGERLRGERGPSVKAQRSSFLTDSGREATLAREMPGSPLCLIDALRPMWELRMLKSNPKRLLFPDTRKGKFRREPMSGKEWNRRLKAMLKLAGISKKFTARSTRPGQRADLLAAGVSEENRDQLGRWASRNRKTAGAKYDRLQIDVAELLPKE